MIRKTCHVTCYQRSTAQTFTYMKKRIWNSIYFHKIEIVVDKNIAEFNYIKLYFAITIILVVGRETQAINVHIVNILLKTRKI